jgi:hypothetical protein
MDLKYLVTNSRAFFESYRQGFFIYQLVTLDKDFKKYTFPIPIDDIGTGTMEREMKPLHLMRWIRKAIDDKTLMEVK